MLYRNLKICQDNCPGRTCCLYRGIPFVILPAQAIEALFLTLLLLVYTRANPRNPIFKLNPEIERTKRELRQRARVLMANRNNGQDPIDEKDPPRQHSLSPVGRAIVPPIPQNNQTTTCQDRS
ncbi:hypothetical protein V6N11_071530 [Hibiscus sabdariffa]|uniref:Uncharacterized protein n=1 Tax=Hibiscus sabdariffa TaxID=183260 RepID=A0ABR2U0C3_9ROSI